MYINEEESTFKDHPPQSRRSSCASILRVSLNVMRDLLLKPLSSTTLQGRRMTSTTFLLGLLLLGTFMTFLNVSRLNSIISQLSGDLSSGDGKRSILPGGHHHKVKRFAVHGNRVDSGYLRHVFEAFERYGYSRVNASEDDKWDVLWSHDYPFRIMQDQMKRLRPGQKVNHFPGSGYITNKMNLATSDLAYVPKAFQIPKDKEALTKYARENMHKKFVQKSNNHRGIKIEKLENLDLSKNGTFIQEYIGNPLLINGHKFDIGVYTILTSINPLRVYIYREVLFRFCPEQYHPFDPDVVDKYVVGDDYLPLWKVPDLEKYYNDLGFGMRDSFDAWYASTKKSPEWIWAQVESAIRTIYLSKEKSLMESTKRFPGNGKNFFEMVRFDFVIDDEGKVYIMEANMSPNLSSAHFPPNRLLYEQVLFNLFGLVGVGTGVARGRLAEDTAQVASKQISVYPKECFQENCLHDCKSGKCALCMNCLNEETTEDLKLAFLEFVNRGECLRVFPPSNRYSHASNLKEEEKEKIETLDNYDLTSLSKMNQLQVMWFRGKCEMDPAFC